VSNSELKSVEGRNERRRHRRICVPFHATVRGVDDEGKKFTVATVTDNMSSNGLYLRIMPRVKIGASLAIEIALHKSLHATKARSHILVDGVVLRTEKKAGGVLGVAVAFEHVRVA
jgi:PilZ domain